MRLKLYARKLLECTCDGAGWGYRSHDQFGPGFTNWSGAVAVSSSSP
jgi:hypothetical protein